MRAPTHMTMTISASSLTSIQMQMLTVGELLQSLLFTTPAPGSLLLQVLSLCIYVKACENHEDVTPQNIRLQISYRFFHF